ncbi:serine/threonine protein kinase [Bisporella sp. PMI_857]|nr:serine/threonine protein kinase [Bisporella sp. PMI_857]
MQRNSLMKKAPRCIRFPCHRGNRKFSANMKKRQPDTVDTSDPANPLFNYTSGRWIYNEDLRLSERRLYFNVNELCSVVAKSVGLPRTDITLFTKIAEGGSYRVFEVTFRDGLKVIVRLPYPSTIPHSHGVPIPKVFDWDSSASNQIGSEYIIMERVQSRELADTWYMMTFKERMAVMEKIIDIERILFSVQFPASGSLFFKDSLDAGVKRICVGPSTEYLWWYQRRSELSANRGPWKSSEELLRAVGEREVLWLRTFGEKRYPREPLYREFYGNQKVDPQLQINYLLDYFKVTSYLSPKAEALNIPTIRHPDLSPSNIFISDSGNIAGIHFQNHGDDDSENFRRPKLADDFAAMTDGDKEKEMELYRRRQVHYFYLGYTSSLNKAHFHAMGKHNLVLRNQLYDIASRPWEGDNTSLQAQLIKTLAIWPEICSPEDSPPVHYSHAEAEQCLARDAKQKQADEQIQEIRDLIGINIEGWVQNGEFENAREKARLIKNEMAESAETEEERSEFEKYWPFQNHEEID